MCNLKKFFPLFLLIVSLGSKAEIIEKIDIIGLDTISRGTILSYLALESGDEISKDALEKSYANLLASDLFSKVELNFVDKSLKINLVENPTIKFLEFKGFKEDQVLNEQIVLDIQKNFNLEIGKIFVRKNFDKLLTQLANLYESNAFYKSKITVKYDQDEKNRIGLEIMIEENERALIGSFQISGNKHFSNDDLTDLFDMGEPDFFVLNYFTENDHFDKKKFDAGLQTLINKYTSEGYLDVKVSDSQVKYDSISDKLNIKIAINEGIQHKVGNIYFTGDLLNLSASSLKSEINLQKGDFFKRAKIISGIEEIKKRYKDSGYAFVNVNSTVEKNNEFLDIKIDINPDSRIYISRINISGNTRTQDDVVRRKIKLLEGEVYSKSVIEDSINRIRRLGYFSSVKYDLKRRATEPDIADIFIEVVETKTGEFTIGLSHSNSTGASLNAGISQNNILGTGNIFNAAISNSSAVEELSFYFKNPYFSNDGHSLSYGIFNKSIDASSLDAASYTLDESGFVVGYGIPLSQVSDLFGEIRFSSIDLKCGSDLKNIYEVSQCSETKDMDNNFSLTYSSNSLNDVFFPSDGSTNSLTTVIGMPFSDFKYYKIEGRNRAYSPILGDKVLKFANRINFAKGYGGDDLPFFKRYFEGGSSSVRGFNFNSLGAKYTNDKPKGGELSFVSSVGVASPTDIIGIDNENMRLIGFIDTGAIAEKASLFDLNDIRSSIGLQLSWLTPIGPIGLHVAKPIIKKQGDDTKSLAFELGAKF